MIFEYNGNKINTNLGGYSYQKLLNGEWKIGLINDNNSIKDESSRFYEDIEYTIAGKKEKHRSFRNKVNVKLIDNTFKNAHIIHWCPSGGYFCITFNKFWDQFD